MKHFFFAFLLTLPTITLAAEQDLTGYIAVDTRFFPHDPLYEDQRENNGPSLAVEPEYYILSDDESHTFTFRPFLRLDPYDSKRSHADIRDLSWLYTKDKWEVKTGLSKVFWGVIETKHLVNIINQTDAVEDLDEEDKLGQPMVSTAYHSDYGTMRLFYLPYFRERTFPGKKGRLRGPLIIDEDNALYDSGAKEWHQDLALRYEHTLGNWDMGLAHFWGTSREPRFLTNASATTLFPYYDIINQTSLDLQYTEDAWLWKLEAFTRNGHGRSFGAVSAGVEYTFFDVYETGADIGLLSEYHFDDRNMETAPPTTLENDAFFGTRFALNDVADLQILGGIMVDTNDQSTAYTIEASRRFGDHWKVELDFRLSGHTDEDNLAYPLRDDDFVQLRLARYF